MGSLHLAVEVGRARFDINMPDPFVFDMPVKLCLEFVAPIGTDGVYSKWEFFDHIIANLKAYLTHPAQTALKAISE